MCKGEAPTRDGGWKYFVAWERGLLGATKPQDPHVNPPPFVDVNQQKFTVSLNSTPTTAQSTEDTPRKCGSCGGPKTWGEVAEKAIADGAGPGSQLLKIYKEAGVPTCPACISMALQMNRWGTKGCTEKIEEIVEDIFPRAKIWLAENRPFIGFLLGNAVGDAAIKMKIKSDIQKAISKSEATLP